MALAAAGDGRAASKAAAAADFFFGERWGGAASAALRTVPLFFLQGEGRFVSCCLSFCFFQIPYAYLSHPFPPSSLSPSPLVYSSLRPPASAPRSIPSPPPFCSRAFFPALELADDDDAAAPATLLFLL